MDGGGRKNAGSVFENGRGATPCIHAVVAATRIAAKAPPTLELQRASSSLTRNQAA